MDQRQDIREDGRLSDLKKELIGATRREAALKARLSKLVEKNDEMQDELEEQRKILEEASHQVKRIDGDVPEKGGKQNRNNTLFSEVQQLSTVTVCREEDKTRTSLEKKEAELQQILELLELSNQQEQTKLQALRLVVPLSMRCLGMFQRHPVHSQLSVPRSHPQKRPFSCRGYS